MSGPARLDPRSLKTLLKLVKDYAEFSEVTVSVGDLTLSVKRSERGPAHETAPAVTKSAKPRQAPEPRHAIASLGEMPPAFSMGNG